MKKNMLLMSFLMISGAVSSLKAELAVNPHAKSNWLLFVDSGKDWSKVNEIRKDPSKYLTSEKLKRYETVLAQENAQIQLSERWYKAKVVRNAALENLKKVLSDLDKVKHSEAPFSYEFQVGLARFMQTVDEEYTQEIMVDANK